MPPRIAVLIPCYNEEISIKQVVSDFKKNLPQATVYVYDNNSSDHTAQAALAAGADVRSESLQGKGHVVRRMFRDIDADFYVMVDGDDTYDANSAPAMLHLALNGPCDLVNCIRVEQTTDAYRSGHRLGNVLLTGTVRLIFGNRVQDMLSGYKVFSRRFVKSFPALSHGFDIETELTVHALELSLPVAHLQASYKGRPEGSVSKLHTWRDGWRIAKLILRLIRHERPVIFFGILGSSCAAISVALAVPLFSTYLRTGLVPRLPTAVLSTGLMIIGTLCFFTGIILDTVSRGRRELRQLAYLQEPPYPHVEQEPRHSS